MEEVFQQLESSEFYLGNPLIISATTLAYKLAQKSDKNLEVYFVGFDFDFQTGYSSKVSQDFSRDSLAAKKILIETQLEIFLKLKYLLGGSKLSIKHVGSQHFSDISSSAFNKKFHSSNNPHTTSRNSRTEITAEITTNHLGDVELAMMMISRAAQDGSDFVKLQMRDVDSFYNRDQLDLPYRSPFGNTFREYRHGLEFTDAEFEVIDAHCRSLEIKWFASVLDSTSFKRALDLKMPMIKLPSTISEKKSYLLEVSEKFEGDLVLSTGMTDESYLDWILSTFKKQSKIYILHANSAYPTPLEDCNIAVIKNYVKIAERNNRIVPGYSSHDPGSLGSLLALASGAQMLEKHVKWGNNPWLHFDNVALDLSIGEFESYVADVRNAEICLGDGIKRITPSEHHKY
jgi:N-acetylneuraminate synthase